MKMQLKGIALQEKSQRLEKGGLGSRAETGYLETTHIEPAFHEP